MNGHVSSGRISKRMKLIAVALTASVIFMSGPASAFASTNVNTGTVQPSVSGTFPVSIESTGTYAEPTNTFYDGSPKYYLITQDAAKASDTQVVYQGVTYALSGVYVGTDINLTGSFFAANATVFFDSGTYNDGDATAYTRFSAENLSLVGLNGAASTALTKSAHASDGTIERNTIMHKNIYLEGITFDGLSRNMCSADAGNGYGKKRGEFYFYFSGVASPWTGSDGFVMNNCVIQNVGSSNDVLAKNLAINIYKSSGQHNFVNLVIRNMKTAYGLGIVSTNDSSNNYFKNLTIDASSAPDAYSIKIESISTGAVPFSAYNNVFSGTLNLTQSGLNGNVYIQDYTYNSTTVPSAYQYAQYSTTNGTTSSSAVNVYSTLPNSSTDKAVLDLRDNYWVVQSGTAVSVTEQLAAIKSVLVSVANAGGVVPSANIKLVSNGGVINDAFTIPDFGVAVKVNIAAVTTAADSYSSNTQIALGSTASITLPTANAGNITLYNFDFDTNLKYTLQEAITGIDPAGVTLSDPYETAAISAYPIYTDYAPTANVSAKIANATADTFANCRFTSLVNGISITNTVPVLGIGDSITFTAQLTDSDTNSFTAAGYLTNMKGTANDQTINWFSSDPSIISIDQTTGTATVHSVGTVSIIAKAMDTNNNGEIEKPFASVNVSIKNTLTPTPIATVTTTTTTPTGITAVVGSTTATAPIPVDLNPAVTAPAQTETITDNPAPLAGGSSWALLNLLLMIGALGIALASVITYFRKKDQDEEVKRKLGWRLASVVVAIAAIITFLLTEDMSASMTITDNWTILMAVYALVSAAVMILSTKKKQNVQMS